LVIIPPSSSGFAGDPLLPFSSHHDDTLDTSLLSFAAMNRSSLRRVIGWVRPWSILCRLMDICNGICHVDLNHPLALPSQHNLLSMHHTITELRLPDSNRKPMSLINAGRLISRPPIISCVECCMSSRHVISE
jgi:hypothetical protein